jgi:pilus assembly protein TadC
VTSLPLLPAVLAALAVLVRPSSPTGRRRRRPASDLPAATVDEAAAALGLVAAALRGGTGSVEALEAVASVDDGPAGRELGVVAAAHRWGEASEQAWARVGPGWSAAAVAWHAALEAGAAPAGLLAAAASRMRESESRRLEAALQKAGVLLVLPLGLCFLPGFVATTIVPVVLHLLHGLQP